MLTSENGRRAALTAFFHAPRLRDAAHIHLGGISLLLHLLLDTPGRLVVLSRITPHISNAEVKKIWEAWSLHLSHEETPARHGSPTRDFFANILTSSPTNAGEQAEAENLICLYVIDTIRESILRTHTVEAPQDEQMPQSSSKRGREEIGDTEDTGTYPVLPQTCAPIVEDPTPQRDP